MEISATALVKLKHHSFCCCCRRSFDFNAPKGAAVFHSVFKRKRKIDIYQRQESEKSIAESIDNKRNKMYTVEWASANSANVSDCCCWCQSHFSIRWPTIAFSLYFYSIFSCVVSLSCTVWNCERAHIDICRWAHDSFILQKFTWHSRMKLVEWRESAWRMQGSCKTESPFNGPFHFNCNSIKCLRLIGRKKFLRKAWKSDACKARHRTAAHTRSRARQLPADKCSKFSRLRKTGFGQVSNVDSQLTRMCSSLSLPTVSNRSYASHVVVDVVAGRSSNTLLIHWSEIGNVLFIHHFRVVFNLKMTERKKETKTPKHEMQLKHTVYIYCEARNEKKKNRPRTSNSRHSSPENSTRTSCSIRSKVRAGPNGRVALEYKIDL